MRLGVAQFVEGVVDAVEPDGPSDQRREVDLAVAARRARRRPWARSARPPRWGDRWGPQMQETAQRQGARHKRHGDDGGSCARWRACRSEPQMPPRRTSMSSCPLAGVGVGRSTTSSLALVQVTAFIWLSVAGRHRRRCLIVVRRSDDGQFETAARSRAPVRRHDVSGPARSSRHRGVDRGT